MASNVAVALVALLHIYFLVLEMFLWDKPRGRRIFGLTPEFASATKSLAANQGLYNGFFTPGRYWGPPRRAAGHAIKKFFTACRIVPCWIATRSAPRTTRQVPSRR